MLELTAMSDEKLEPPKKWIHDLNNRVGAILATAELLQLEPLPPRAAERTRNIESEALAMRELLRKLAGYYMERE